MAKYKGAYKMPNPKYDTKDSKDDFFQKAAGEISKDE
jgi:hypothetical protein